MTRYDAAYLALAPLALPYIAWRWVRKKRYRQSGPGMFGRGLPRDVAARRYAAGSVWIHAVSVGEVAAARAVEPELRRLFPNLPFLITTTTETGQEAARRTIPTAEAHAYFPADLSCNVKRFLGAYHPRAIFIMETEIWPNFITLAARRGAKVFWINGKLSDRSYPRYRLLRGVLRPVVDAIRGICAQTDEDAWRFAELGVAEDRIRVTGNCKFDLSPPILTPEDRIRLRAELGLLADQPVIVAGSTHEDEEEIILDAMDRVREKVPNAALILAPRHPERFDRVAELASRRGLRVHRASEGNFPATEPPPQIVVLDQMGVLARTYGLGEAAIVAGSFCEVGGHNLLEAAAHAIPVIFGPNMKSQREIAHLFKAAHAGTQTEPGDLAEHLLHFLQYADDRREEGLKALRVLEANQGSARRAAEAVQDWMEMSGES